MRLKVENAIAKSNMLKSKRRHVYESNYNCENPNEVYYDLIVKKIYCSSGIGVQKKLALVRVLARS